MKALVYTAPHTSLFQDVDDAEAKTGEAIVSVAFCGICGSDMHAWHGHDERRVPPLVLGHEVVGVAMSGRHAGKRVAINPLMTCGNCDFCSSGMTHLCAEREMIGMKRPGGFAEAVAISDDNLFPLDDGLTFEDAALAEPLACCVHGVKLMTSSYSADFDARVVVLGGGAIGLLAAKVLEVAGYTDIWVAEVNILRAKMLQQILSAHIYNPLETQPEGKAVAMIFDAVGTGATRKAAMAMIAPGGVIVHIGLQDNKGSVDSRRLTLQEITFMGSYCYNEADFAESLTLLTNGMIGCQGFTEFRPLKEGGSGFIDIDQGVAPPKIILEV